MVKEHVSEFKREFLDKTSSFFAAALGLVAALAWNEAVQTLFKRYYTNGDSLMAKVIYAVIVTAIVVLITLWITKAASKIKK